jgi:single-stranded-DNA-specific exonuclease
MPRPVAAVLARRAPETDEATDAYLNPRLDRLQHPDGLPDLDRAVARVLRAVDAGETVFVHGDYDVDGITGTAFLTRTLRAMDAKVVPYVPGRSEGYGLRDRGIAAATAAGAQVLITVDTGTRAVDAVAEAQKAGLDVIVLDHHAPGDTLPAALVVNPLRGDHPGFVSLSAVGVAAKFMHAMGRAAPRPALREAYREALQLVALGTIADMVPLIGENRIFVTHGLVGLARSRWAGVKALKATAGLTRDRVTSADVAFFLAPRLNAAGRMGEARDALDLLLTDDPAEAYRIAERMEGQNRSRRRAEENAMQEALETVRGLEPLPPALVLWADGWEPGIVGIVAGRLLERFQRPVFLIAMGEEIGRGSARSFREFPLPAALVACDDLLLEHGGHAEAAGFGIHRNRLEAFRERVAVLAAAAPGRGADGSPVELDAAVELDEITPDCVRWLDRLAPFGRGNPEPLFGAEGLTVAGPATVVGKRHLKLELAWRGTRLSAIAFHQGDRVRELERGGKVDAAFHAAFDTWRGGQAVQLVVRDLRMR